MTDWVQKQIDLARARRGKVQGAPESHASDDQRPALWDSLLEIIGNTVGRFNEEVGMAKPIQFTKHNDESFSVKKEDPLVYNVSAQLQRSPTRFVYTLSGSTNIDEQMQVLRQETLTFDVDADGHDCFVLGTQRLNVDEVMELVLGPIFGAVA